MVRRKTRESARIDKLRGMVSKEFAQAAKPSYTHLRQGRDRENDAGIRISRDITKRSRKALTPLAGRLESLLRQGVVQPLGGLALTVFDTSQHPWCNPALYIEEKVKDGLQDTIPTLFEAFTAPVKGLALFGNSKMPFVGITFSADYLVAEQLRVIDAFSNQLAPFSVDSETNVADIKPHISVAKVFSRQRAHEVRNNLMGVLPETIVFQAATVMFRGASD